jgi:citrate synthase
MSNGNDDKGRGARPHDVPDWWSTAIIDMQPGAIRLRGHPIEELIGNVSFPQMVWLMTRGDLPGEAQARLLEAALVSAVDHGPQAPSIAAARMSVTCGLGLNGAMATAVNMLDDVHGGAGEQALELFTYIADAVAAGEAVEVATARLLDTWRAERGKFVPGFGHRFHKPEDPRTPRLLSLLDAAVSDGVCAGRSLQAARAVQAALDGEMGRPVPMNVDGATAVVYAELGFAPPLARGLFCLSRSVGAMAHAWEQMQQGGRNKGPTPPHYRWTYTGDNPIDG